MTTERYERIPALTLGWRLKMSLAERGISREQIAVMMDVTPSTISRWMADKGAPPKRPYLLQWALSTGVPVQWLETGEGSSAPSPPDPGSAGDKLARLTEQKRGRATRSRSTRQLFPAFARTAYAA